jgi:hypothetical protein
VSTLVEELNGCDRTHGGSTTNKMTRGTRLGEFPTIGRLFTLGSLGEMTEIAHTFGLFFHGLGYALILAKMRCATFWAMFSHNSSGRTEINLTTGPPPWFPALLQNKNLFENVFFFFFKFYF